MTASMYDAIVDESGLESAYTTVDAAIDDFDGGPAHIYVKKGNYAGFTMDAAFGFVVEIEPGSVITSAIVVSGVKNCLIVDTGSDLQGAITVSGAGASLLCENGVTGVGVVGSGARIMVDGGGLGTVMDGGNDRIAVLLSGGDGIAKNLTGQTTPGGSGGFETLKSNTVARAIFANCKVIDSDNDGLSAGIADTLWISCTVLDADDDGVVLLAARGRLIGCYIISGDVGILTDSNGDDSVIVGNISDPTNSALTLAASGDNCVAVGNRLDGAATDSSTGSVVADNDETAF